MTRIRLTLAYDGTDFCGWQLQPRDRTVQGELEKALSVILETPVRVHGAGRTDAGVHAMGQVVHFDVPAKRATVNWQRSLNSLLPDDVSVLDARIAVHDFHSRYSALSKTYEYSLWNERTYILPHRRKYTWACGKVDVSRMEAAAEVLLGEHDFSAFQNMGTVIKTTVRTVSEISHHPGETRHETVWRFRASGFLKQMVRNIMGCMVRCGRGKISPEDVKAILESCDRTQAPATAPARGLSMIHVEYGD